MSVVVVVFARAPVPGRVKTRLAAAVGPEAAAAVYRALLDHTLAAARASGLDVTLALAVDQASDWRPPAGVAVVPQGSGELGERMQRAFAERFAVGAAGVVLVGSDLPGLSAELFRQAAAALDDAAVVLGPAADGGYWLVGQRAPGVDLFSGVPWSSPRTLAATRQRLVELGVDHRELPVLGDVDTVADLAAAVADQAVEPRLRERLARAL